MEDLFRRQMGVISTQVGYAGGSSETARYEKVKTGTTGHAEAIQIEFDPNQTNLESLFKFFFKIHDPTTLNRQGNDVGSQYRSAIFYDSKIQKDEAEKVIKQVEQRSAWGAPLATTLEPLKGFYPAEDYHQDYLEKNPGGYTCHYVRKIEI